MKTLTIITMGVVLTGCATQDGKYYVETPPLAVKLGKDGKFGSIYTYMTFGYITPEQPATPKD